MSEITDCEDERKRYTLERPYEFLDDESKLRVLRPKLTAIGLIIEYLQVRKDVLEKEASRLENKISIGL